MAESVFVLWGSSGHAKVLNSAIELTGGRVEAVFDNNPLALRVLPKAELFFGVDGFQLWLASITDAATYAGLAAIGGARGPDRLKIHALFEKAGLHVPALIHPRAFVCPTASIGAGCQILAHSTIGSDAHLGSACIINHAATVDHECRLGDGVHIGPGATLCGCIEVETNAFVGAGSVVLPRVKIGKYSVIGAGAVVTRNVPAFAVVVGNPARIQTPRAQL